MTAAFLVASAFLASAVEMVEALTIVVAMGTTRDWRSALTGVGAAIVVLAAVVAALGPALRLVPISDLRLIVGALSLVFGLQWLRKAILRSAGLIPLHDEAEIFERERRKAQAPRASTGRASTGSRSRSRSRASCSRGSRSPSSF